MKGLFRIFLLVIFLLLNGHSFHAESFRGYENYTPVKIPDLVNYSGIGNSLNIPPCIITYSHSFVKKEYRKLRGTNEEDDEDEKLFSLKKTETSLQPHIELSYCLTLAFHPSSFSGSNDYIKHCLSFFRHSSDDSSNSCYILYQVFRI